MDNETGGAPAGWYPAPHGGQRYWDGQRWLPLPDPDEAPGAPVQTTPGDNKTGGKTKLLLAATISAVVLAGAVIGGLFWKNNHDTQMRNKAAAAAEAEAAAAAATEAAAERARRAGAVGDIEDSVATLAEKHAADGLFDGPILEVSCVPVDGGSTDDLTEKTTVFDCFAATEDNGDGTMRGRKYHATMNWNTGEYTYGYGSP